MTNKVRQENIDTVWCGNCKGSGREQAEILQDTGEVQYRVCPVCNGTGSVAVDRSYFTNDPYLSLSVALELMQRLGKPEEICIAGNHDIRVLFKDGSRYVLGGFTVGYHGTGPDCTKRLLDAAGFHISIDKIAEMEPPVTLVAGGETLIFHAPTLEEARRTAIQSVPSDARIISLEVVCDGTTLKTAEGRGVSEDVALRNANRSLPEGAVIKKKDVEDVFDTGFYGKGNSEDAALEDAKRHIFSRYQEGAAIEKKEVVRAGSQGKVSVEAFSYDEAKRIALSQIDMRTWPLSALSEIKDRTIISCTREPRLSFFRKGKPGTYEVSWLIPWEIIITIREKKVTLTYRPRAAVQVRFKLSSKLKG